VDPVTQGTLGAAAALAILMPRAPLPAGKLALMGALGGMAPDLDVLIRSDDDPLLAIEFHRHFTHSLAFIPVGGFLASLPWWFSRGARPHMRWVFFATTIGYATHGLLDCCTTYGTLLFWPFSMTRLSWCVVSVVDPLFTLPLLMLIAVALKRRAVRWVNLGLVWGGLYLASGAVQRERALAVQRAAAKERHHLVTRSAVFPSFMSNITWRSVYQSNGRYYVDKIRVTWTGRACLTPGTELEVARAAPPDGKVHPAAARAHRLFRWFSLDWVAPDPKTPGVLGDVRYSFSPTEGTPIWGVAIDDRTGAVEWVNNRGMRDIDWGHMLRLLAEDGAGHRCY
jgi:inner membrane protein